MAAEIAAMDRGDLQGCLATNIASPFCESIFRQRVGRPRKYEGLCNKRIYLAELTLEKLRTIKSSNRLGSDNAAVQHLIARHEYLCTMDR